MNREQAIKMLKSKMDGHTDTSYEWAETVRMAIKALEKDKTLEQEPCEDTISRQAAIRWVKTECNPYGKPTLDFESGKKVIGHLKQMPSAQPQTEWNNHTVACLLAELFGDACACNYNGIDEWLPEKCEVIDACPNPVGVACWEQFLKHRAESEGEK
jgi:hypothetical protein